eukprot:m.92253 g.92253  ORF g.92253 m.92253 type:complete len:561 (+) comp14659_c1_seq2:121-1803(+)
MSEEKPSMLRAARAATVSSATPLRHKNPYIPQDIRDRFNALDLEVLLSEFRVVADEQDDDVEDSSGDQDLDPEHEAKWLAETGFESLAQKFEAGKHITDADIEAQMAGFSAQQKRAVKARAHLLNETLSKRGIRKPSKPSAKDIFTADPDPPQADEIRQRLLSQAANVPIMYYDLSEEDQKQVHQLNLIQLTALLEGVEDFRPLADKKKKRKAKTDSPLFGTPLEKLVERDRRLNPASMESSEIPIFFSRIMTFLEKHGVQEEGIFRKAGSAARIKELRQICEDAFGDIDFEKAEVRPHDASALLKQFLRETPEPLLTDNYIEAFSMTQHLEDQLYGLQLLVMLLPKVHRACLRRLLSFLVKVAQHSGVNKMGTANLAVVFAPTLFYVRGHKGKRMLKEVEIQVTTASTLKLMLENHEKLWEVPNDIMAQIRFVNESRLSGRKANKPKDLKRLLTERKSGLVKATKCQELMVEWVAQSDKKPRVEARVSVLGATGEVQPQLEVTELTTCSDILKMTHTPPNYHLFECGGNINRRRIDPRSRILPILRINPGLTLMVMGSS